MSNFLAKKLSPAKYRLLGLVGHGQFGRVYCAIHRKTGRLVALKELDRQRFSTHKFLRELRFLLSLQHENIVTCQALEHTQTRRYLVMDYCEGGTLRSLLNEDVRLHPLEGLKLISQILAGLEHAHQRSIVHCDIKPENILLELTATGWRARITDFGIAQLSQSLEKEEFSNTGSPAYMAPERFYGQYSPASDLYAVGILIYEILVGHRPFSGLPAELMSAHLNQPVKVPAWMPIELKTLILTALQKLPARRFRSATEMAHCLQGVIAQVESQLSQGWAASTLIRPSDSPHPSPFYAVDQAELVAEVAQLVSSNPAGHSQTANSWSHQLPVSATIHLQQTGFFQVFGSKLCYRTYNACQPENIVQPPSSDRDPDQEPDSPNFILVATVEVSMAMSLPEPIVDLAVRPQGCFAITRRSVFFLPLHQLLSPALASSFSPPISGKGNWVGQDAFEVMPERLVTFVQDVKVAIAPQGNWLAGITQTPSGQNQLQIWTLPKNRENLQPSNLAIACQSHPSFQILALDQGHMATFAHLMDPHSPGIMTGTWVEIFTRRRDFLGSHRLSLPLDRVFATSTPYRLLATEPALLRSLLFFELKPFRLQRIGLPIIPHFVALTSWGYVLMEKNGATALLDQQGRIIGQTRGPDHPTAIAALDEHRLAITTWNEGKGALYLVDLRTLDLDFVF